jgi:hypothetical protein
MRPFQLLHHVAETWIRYSLLFITILSIVACIAYSFGWIHRLIWWIAERELSKILNHTPVTIGCLRYDLVRGKVWGSNVIIHSPKRDEWYWESPLLARIGSIYVETNLLYCIFADWCLREQHPLELDTIIISDVQVFVERKHHVFNFILLDPHVILPEAPPPPSMSMASSHSTSSDHLASIEPSKPKVDPMLAQIIDSDNHETIDEHRHFYSSNVNSTDSNGSSSSIPAIDSEPTDDGTSEKAHQILSDMVKAVQSIGRAVVQKKSLQNAFDDQRQQLASHLRAIQQQPTGPKVLMEESVKIAQVVSQTVVAKTQSVHSQLLLPPRRTIPGEKTVYARVGRLILSNARVFTRDHYGSDDDVTSHGSNPMRATTTTTTTTTTWNKPIVIRRLVLKATDLCPPSTMNDATITPYTYGPEFAITVSSMPKSFPAVYQPFDKILDIAWRHVLAEATKTNPGQLFQTTLGELLDYYRSEQYPMTSSTATAATSGATTAATTITAGTGELKRTNRSTVTSLTSTQNSTPGRVFTTINNRKIADGRRRENEMTTMASNSKWKNQTVPETRSTSSL